MFQVCITKLKMCMYYIKFPIQSLSLASPCNCPLFLNLSPFFIFLLEPLTGLIDQKFIFVLFSTSICLVFHIITCAHMNETILYSSLSFLIYFPKPNTLQVHPGCFKWQNFALFYSQIVFHCGQRSYLSYSFIF